MNEYLAFGAGRLSALQAIDMNEIHTLIHYSNTPNSITARLLAFAAQSFVR
jgi:hypothetical protein